MKYTYTRIHNESVGGHIYVNIYIYIYIYTKVIYIYIYIYVSSYKLSYVLTTRKLHYMYAYKNIWNGISNGKYKLSLNVSISCIDISGLLGDIFKILHMNTLAYCIMSR